MEFTGKGALVTGGSNGIGKAICKALLQRGAKVSFLDMNEETGQATKTEFQNEFGDEMVRFTKCDVTNQAEMEDAFLSTKDSFGTLDIVCNNAGIMDEDNWELTIDVNLKGAMRGTHLAIKHMQQDNGGNGGVIINLSSKAGLCTSRYFPAYSASKWGVIGFTRSMAESSSLIKAGIRLNTICPDGVNTDLFKNAKKKIASSLPAKHGSVKHGSVKFTPMSPDAVANGVIQLMEDQSRNGAVMYIESADDIRYITMPDLVSKVVPE